DQAPAETAAAGGRLHGQGQDLGLVGGDADQDEAVRLGQGDHPRLAQQGGELGFGPGRGKTARVQPGQRRRLAPRRCHGRALGGLASGARRYIGDAGPMAVSASVTRASGEGAVTGTTVARGSRAASRGAPEPTSRTRASPIRSTASSSDSAAGASSGAPSRKRRR